MSFVPFGKATNWGRRHTSDGGTCVLQRLPSFVGATVGLSVSPEIPGFCPGSTC